MSLRTSIDQLSNLFFPMGGDLAGISYEVTRPTVSGTGLVQTPVRTSSYRMEQGFKDQPQPLLNGVQYYQGYGATRTLLPGDLFTDPQNDSFRLTFMHFFRLQGMCLLQTDRTGSFYNGKSLYLGDVPYAWMNNNTASPVEEALSGQLDGQTRKIVLWAHTPLRPENTELQAMRFVETDGTRDRRWVVSSANRDLNLLTCVLRLE